MKRRLNTVDYDKIACTYDLLFRTSETLTPMTTHFSIREAASADALAIAEIHVASWQTAYRGLIPDEVLDNLSVDRWSARWTDRLSQPTPHRRTWLVEHSGQPVGFCSTGPSRDAGHNGLPVGEVYAVYLRPQSFGQGAGRLVMNHTLEDLRKRGFSTVVVWVLIANERARRFYEAAGFRADAQTKTTEAEEHGCRFKLSEMRMILSLVTK
jgi:RimJ/RimL family protein N-acetyltransferase